MLITKESLDKFIKSMVGVPVIINHKDVTDKNADDLRVGVVNSVWYDNKDGWYWCDGIIWDETAINLINDKGWSVSCSYNVTKADNEGGSENNIKYDMEFLDGVFTHLALVDNPRYERANIVFNSKTEILNDKWVTIKPNGEEHKGRHLLIKDGENVYDAMRRQWGVDVKGQQHLFDRKKYKTDTNYKDELYGKLQEHLKNVQKRYDNLEYLGVAEPDKLKDEDYEDISFEEWEDKQKDNKETYYEEDNEEYYTKDYFDAISKDYDNFMKSKKEEKEQPKEETKQEENRKTQANYGKEVTLKDKSKSGKIIGSVPRGENPDTKEKMYLYEVEWDDGTVERIHSEKVNVTKDENISEIWKDRWEKVKKDDFYKIKDTDSPDDILEKRKKLKDIIVKGHTVGGEKLDEKSKKYLNKIEQLDESMFREQNRRLKANNSLEDTFYEALAEVIVEHIEG